MQKSIIFILFWSSYLLGIFLHNIIQSFITSLLVLLFLVVLFLWLFIFRKKWIIIYFFILLWFLFWIIVSDFNYYKIEQKNIIVNNLIGEKNQYKIKILWINKITKDQKVYIWEIKNYNIKWEIYTKSNYELKKWDIIKINSKIFPYEDFNDFEYKKYMASKWLYYRVYPFTFDLVSNFKINFLESKILSFREYLLDNIKKIFPWEEWLFLWWILVGARESLPDKLSDNFNNSWLTHFIAVSWFNITILIVWIWFFIKFLPWYLKIIIISITIILFTILVWFTAPVIRASIMWIIWFYTITYWRKTNINSLIIFTLILMVTYSPLSINYDVSLHLSFLAVLWIVYTSSFFEKKLNFITNTLEIRNALSLTLSAFIFTLPIMAVNFWQISIVSPLTNVLVAWTIPIAMLFWFLSVIFLDIFSYLSFFFWFFAHLLLSFDIFVVNFFWGADFSTFKINFWEYKNYFSIIYLLFILVIITKTRKIN